MQDPDNKEQNFPVPNDIENSNSRACIPPADRTIAEQTEKACTSPVFLIGYLVAVNVDTRGRVHSLASCMH
eukprot:249956-Pelagomonas_calceolata.AAC.1